MSLQKIQAKEESSKKDVEQELAHEEQVDVEFFVSWNDGSGKAERGSLYVLWELIRSYKIDIFNVSLLRLTEDFLDFLARCKQLRLDIAASFIHMAARLIYYKSKALLPGTDTLDENDEQRLPPELVNQLLEYRKYQFAAEELREIAEIVSGMRTRQKTTITLVDTPSEENEGIHHRYLDLKLGDLILLYSRLLRQIEQEKQKQEGLVWSRQRYSIKEHINYLQRCFETIDELSFYEVFEDISQAPKGKLVVMFIALLELMRQGFLVLRQKSNFADIQILRKKNIAI